MIQVFPLIILIRFKYYYNCFIYQLINIKKEKSLNSNDQDNVRKKEIKKVNFIQKNKVLVTNKNKNKSNTDIIIRCLNDDIDDSVKVVTTINDDDHLNNSNQIEFEISIISNHSSTISDHNLKDNKQLVQGNEYKPESDLIFSSEYLKLINEKNEYQQDSKENEVNIIKFDQDNKSKIRSQFMQRFGSLNHKRQITPNMIEQNDNNKRTSVEYTPLSTITTTAVDSSPSTLEIKNQLTRFCNSYIQMNDQDPLTTASIAASIAAMSVVNSQPFTKIQNDFDEKITNVLKELETMRKSDEKLFKKKKILENSESSDEEVSSRRNQEKESEFRIKHLERLQEKQFDMMSQLINVIGTENSKADLTAHNGKENVKTFKKQIKKIIEPNYNNNNESEEDDDYEDYIKFTQNLNKNNKNKIQTVRSRSQNKENVVKKRTDTDSKKKMIESSRSRSGSRSCCRMRNSSTQFKNSSEKLDLYEKKNKKTEFLEELLDSALPKIKPNTNTLTINTNLNDTQQPLLFDKYLVNKF